MATIGSVTGVAGYVLAVVVRAWRDDRRTDRIACSVALQTVGLIV